MLEHGALNTFTLNSCPRMLC